MRRVMACMGAAALSAIAVVIAGCAAPTPPIPKYQPPISGATAKLLVRGTTVPPGDRFGIFIFDNAELCQGPHIAAAGTATQVPPGTSVVAGVPVTMDFVLAKPSRQTCSVRFTFTPAAGKTYLVTGGANGAGCAARLLDASDPDNMKPEPSTLRRDSATERCVPMARARKVINVGETSATGEAVLREGATASDLGGLIGQ